MVTTQFKLNWLQKRRGKYLIKVTKAFSTVKEELIDYLNNYDARVTTFIKYLAVCCETSSVMTFIKVIQGLIQDTRKVKGDLEAIRARRLCQYILFRLYYLSNFAIQWTNVTIKCENCRNIVKTNFLYTDKICPYCGHIIVK